MPETIKNSIVGPGLRFWLELGLETRSELGLGTGSGLGIELGRGVAYVLRNYLDKMVATRLSLKVNGKLSITPS